MYDFRCCISAPPAALDRYTLLPGRDPEPTGYVAHPIRSIQISDFKFLISETLRRLHNQRPALKPGFNGSHKHLESIRAAASDFEAWRLLPQSARHQRQRAPGTGPMLVPSLQRYQACPLSKPGIDLCTPDFLSRSVRYQSISHRTDRTVLSGPNLTSHPSQ